MSPNSQSFAICIPQDVPHSTWVLSHMLCPKFNSHVYKLKRYNRMKRAKNPGKIQWSKPSQERQKGRPKKGQKTCNPQNPKECESQFLVGSYHTNSLNRPPPIIEALGALAEPDSAALRRTVWFCCRV